MMNSNSSSRCAKQWQAVSNGVFQGNVPLDFSLPLLIIQISLVIVVTRSLGFLFKPLRQPRVLAEIIGGVLLGPSALGHNKLYLHMIFPESSMALLDTLANIGLLFFLFMVGLELDLKEIRKSGKTAFVLAFAGIITPFLATMGIAALVKAELTPEVRFAPLMVFIAVPLSITAFPVLVRILAERKLLDTEVGRLVMPAAAINDVCAWILLALGVALSGPTRSPATPALVMLCGIGFIVFMLTLGTRFMAWVAKQATYEENMDEIYVAITLMAVLLSGFTTDAIGIHPLFGAFMFGLIVPNEGTFAETLIKKIEDFVTILMLPLFFASSGLKTNLGAINTASSFGFLLLFITTAALCKISSTITVARLSGMTDYREMVSLGFLMNTKGLAELIVLNIGRDLKVLNDQLFAILVLMCLLTTFMTTPVVIALYKPARTPIPYMNRNLHNKDSLRIMACLHGTRSIPSIINLLEAIASGNVKKKKKQPFLKAFAVHLMELSDRPSTILLANRSQRNRSSSSESSSSGDHGIFVAFKTLAQLRKGIIEVKTVRIMSEPGNMHADICATAVEKRVNLIVLPFYEVLREMEVVKPGLCGVNEKVLRHAPCSVAILVDCGLGEWDTAASGQLHIAVLFRGGQDDREALALGAYMAQQPSCITLSVVRFRPPSSSSSSSSPACSSEIEHPQPPGRDDDESVLDEAAIQVFKSSSTSGGNYREVFSDDPVEAALTMITDSTEEFCLLLVGRGRHSSCAENNPELGAMGNALATSSSLSKARDHRLPSILVVQQYSPNGSDSQC